jgi:PAS domain S-box-containing protein
MPETIDIQSLVDTHDRPFIVIDRSFTVVALNQAFEKRYGVKAEDARGKPCYEVNHGRHKPCHELGEECPYRQVYETRQTHSCLHNHKDRHGQEHPVRITAYPLTNPAGELYLGETIQELSAEVALKEVGVSMVGASPSFLHMTEKLLQAARTDSPVLLQGETGTGKELAASFLHQNSRRVDKPFLTLDCTVLTEALFESEVFGHEHGAFTGSRGKR